MTTQHKTTTASGDVKPRITLTTKDYKSLSSLARAAANNMPGMASVLTEELERARTRPLRAFGMHGQRSRIP
jgi:hypothetical protein